MSVFLTPCIRIDNINLIDVGVLLAKTRFFQIIFLLFFHLTFIFSSPACIGKVGVSGQYDGHYSDDVHGGDRGRVVAAHVARAVHHRRLRHRVALGRLSLVAAEQLARGNTTPENLRDFLKISKTAFY